MVKRGNTRLATKTDLVEGLQGLNSKIDGLRTELKGDIDGLKGDIVCIKGDIVGLKASTHRMAVILTDTQASVEDIKDQLKRDRATFDSRITAALEPFTSRMETIWRESIVHPKMLDEQGSMLQRHEERISALEARPAP